MRICNSDKIKLKRQSIKLIILYILQSTPCIINSLVTDLEISGGLFPLCSLFDENRKSNITTIKRHPLSIAFPSPISGIILQNIDSFFMCVHVGVRERLSKDVIDTKGQER